ncbi:SDR family NAD(P)-dependent oxidoreductase [Halalkalibacter sp. APA_J-10(15)]|uniref:SDR family NAD(P)-dependent oxidoreductase n=1 Tax=Halalkalibacter sp. APA_J-10(15) TaxID=2933805 RepID=UPI001FF69766|nr:SDR family NAD(P)-dependent oxidoreductase [Halalkalibacter sp. APA_J-10(15)]MCK0471883.1 SDR family NAD(P)-dependent oxidoreductase [Halalkalibacter sp. APA_J-10(15)]
MKKDWEISIILLEKLCHLKLFKVYKDLVNDNQSSLYELENHLSNKYHKLNQKLIDILVKAGLIIVEKGELTLKSSDEKDINLKISHLEREFQSIPNNVLYNHLNLCNIAFDSMKDILTGKRLATDVLIPEGNINFIEGIYKNNEIADYLNEKVAQSVEAYIQSNLEFRNKSEKIVILEFGAGTGGTTKKVMEKISTYSDQIKYIYTDISKHFTYLGKNQYGHYQFMDFTVFNIENDIAAEKFMPHSVDVMIGANVLHATKNVNGTLKNLKSIMKKDGWLILNELTSDWEFAIYTFGLLEGWWLSEDKEIRIDKSPLLRGEQWREALTANGFKNISSVGLSSKEVDFSQTCIICESNGNVEIMESPTNSDRKFVEELQEEQVFTNSNVEKSNLREEVLKVFADIIHVKADKINCETSLWDYGIDSILMSQVVSRINAVFSVDLKTSDFFKYTNINKIIDYLSQKVKVEDVEEKLTPIKQKTDIFQERQVEKNKAQEVAVIGVSGRFPKANNLEALWGVLTIGEDCVTTVPTDRWKVKEGYFDKYNCKKGCFLEDVGHFDPYFFNLSPKQVELMDPRQRLVLEESWNAFEDAGYSNTQLKGKNVGVYIGCEGESGYLKNKFRDENALDSHLFLGRSNSILASRISYFMDLKGPSITIDTACSSSLVAIHEACEAIKSGTCDMALAGGVQIILGPNDLILLDRMGMLSKDAKCKTFDNHADGFVPGEAVGMILLKRLDEAVRDKDNIYGVIKGSDVNQDGLSNGITAPNVDAQVSLISKVNDKYNIDPKTISYVEAHGTGTKLGDPVEVKALTEAYKKHNSLNKFKQYCKIGSIKTNIGHCGAAAGVSGLVKVLLSLKKGLLPAHNHYQIENAEIEFKNTPFYVSQETEAWESNYYPLRRASVSSFGHSGTNCYMVIEEYKKEIKPRSEGNYPILLSGESSEALFRKIEQLHAYMTNNEDELIDISYTLSAGRSHFEHRIGLIVDSKKSLMDALDRLKNGYVVENLFYSPNLDLKLRKDYQINKEVDLKLENLMMNYINKEQVYWDDYFQEQECYKISLPTYPFNKKRYWVSESVQDNLLPESESKQEFYRLVTINEQDTNSSVKKFHVDLKQDEFYFCEHLVDDREILPGVGYLEISQKALEQWKKIKGNVISNVVFKSPIEFDKNTKIYITLSEHEHYYDFFISTMKDETEHEFIHVQGRLKRENISQAKPIDIEEKKKKLSQVNNASMYYEDIKDLGLNLGESFRVIKNIYTNYRDEALSELQIPTIRKKDFSQMRLHTSIIDGALQGIVALLKNEIESLNIPFFISKVEIYGELEQEGYSLIERIKNNDNSIRSFNIQILNKKGEVLLKISGILARPYQRSLKQEAFKKESRNIHYFTPVLKESNFDTRYLNNEGYYLVIIDGENEFTNSIAHCVKDISKGNYSIISEGNRNPSGDDQDMHTRTLPREYKSVLERVRDIGIQNLNIIYLSSKRTNLEDSKATSFYNYYDILKELNLNSSNLTIRIKHFFKEDNNRDVSNRALVGLFSTLEREYKDLDCKLIALRNVNMKDSQVINNIKNELLYCQSGSEIEVYYDNYVRKTPKWKRIMDEDTTIRFRKNAFYLITGGSKGVGYNLAKKIVETYGANVILLGRSNFDHELEKKINKIKINQSIVEYMKCDISNEEQVSLISDRIKSKGYQINGILHSAGNVHDALFMKKDEAGIQGVLRPKIDGTILIDKYFSNQNLEFFILFSSLTSVVGNIGQTDYGYANSFMDHYSSYRREKGLPGNTVSINWPLWDCGGMKLGNGNSSYILKLTGMEPMSVDEGLKAIQVAQNCNSGQVIVFKGDSNQLFEYMATKKKERRISKNKSRSLNREIQKEIKKAISKVMKMNEADINIEKKFNQYGFDSITFTELTNELVDNFHLNITPALFFEYSVIKDFIAYVEQYFGDKFNMEEYVEEVEVMVEKEGGEPETLHSINTEPILNNPIELIKESSKEPIAIIGMDAIFPGAHNLSEYWNNLINNKISITEIPHDRWDWKEYYGDPLIEDNTMNNVWGGFINYINEFDAKFFKISPKEAKLMDPQQRLFLQTSWRVLEDGGYKPEKLKGQNVGVFVGVSGMDYNELLKEAGVEIDAYTATGNSHAMIANKVSYLLDFRGPSEAIDTACSSSLIAMNKAIKSIRNGECDLAIAGGVNAILSPTVHISFSKAGMLSKSNECRVFDKEANGYIRGEGVGAVLLKPLSKALEDGDHIYALIKGAAENHGGHTNTITSPNPNAQADVILKACNDAGVDFDTLTYIEAHGTGTKLGDSVEMNGLVKAFKESNGKIDQGRYCAIGSVKVNIGHLESAAGIAGVIKVVLAMKNKKIPGNSRLEVLNPYFNLKGTNYRLPQDSMAWEPIKEQGENFPRRAGISSFGFGGSNAHVILEEYVEKEQIPNEVTHREEMIILSAKTEERLLQYAKDMLHYMNDMEKESNTVLENRDISVSEVMEVFSKELFVDSQNLELTDRLQDLGIDAIKYRRIVKYLEGTFELDTDLRFYDGNKTLQEFIEGVRKQISPLLIEKDKGVLLSDIAYTLQVGRVEMESRLAFIARDKVEVKQKLTNFINNIKEERMYTGHASNSLVEELMEKEDTSELINILAKKKKYDSLLKLWVNGTEIKWESIREDKRKKVPLPKYPFANEIYWFNRIPKKGNIKAISSIGTMVDGIDHEAPMEMGHLVYKKLFKASDYILRDHTINGKCVLPGVGHLESICQIARTILKEDTFDVKIQWLAPIVVNNKLEILIYVSKTQDGLKFTLVSKGTKEVTHSEAFVSRQVKRKQRGKVDIEKLKSNYSKLILKDDFYESFRKTSVTHGLYCQSLERLYCGENGTSLCKFRLPPELDHEYSQYLLHPTLMDGALQATVGVTEQLFANEHLPKVPFSIEKISIFSKVPKEGYSFVQKRGKDRFDLTVTDIEGNIVLEIQEMASRELKLNQQTKQATKIIKNNKETEIYQMEWIKFQNEAFEEDYSRKTLIIYTEDSRKIENDLMALYPNAIGVLLSNTFMRISDKEYTIDANDQGAFQKLLSKLVDVDTIYYLALEELEGQVDVLSLESVKNRGVLGLFRLVKSLDDTGAADKKINLKVITNNTHSLQGERIIPYGSSVQGLIKSIAKEFSNWNVINIDLDIDDIENTSVVDLTLSLPDHNNKEIVLRDHQRYTYNLVPKILKDNHSLSFKKHGVYLIIGGGQGVGYELAKYLSRSYQARIFLVGRRKINGDIKEKLLTLTNLGGNGEYIQCDINNHEDVRKLKEKINIPLNGIIHSALVLKDALIKKSDENIVKEVIAPKLDGSVILWDVFKREKLDFMMFFSSFQSFSGSLGQSSYTAACSFKDTFAKYVGIETDTKIKIINWGYFSDVGVVASEQYKKSLHSKGVYSIDLGEAFSIIESFLKDDASQIIAVKFDRKIIEEFNSQTLVSTGNTLLEEYQAINSLSEVALVSILDELGLLEALLTQKQLKKDMIRIPLSTRYTRLINELISYSNLNKSLLVRWAEQVKQNKDLLTMVSSQYSKKYPSIMPYVTLLHECVKNYIGVLKGELLATDIMFPEASLRYVENLYKNNNIADYYNELVASQVKEFIKLNPNKKVRILEIGAGTGGTSEKVLKEINRFGDRISYYYTDVSIRFLQHASKQFANYNHFVRYQILDIEKNAEIQTLQQSFDLIIATNVIHATKNISTTLGNIRTLLKAEGKLLLNETVEKSLYLTLTFGLVDGWWLFNDENVRVSGSPLLKYDKWVDLLKEQQIFVSNTNSHHLPLGQRIIYGTKYVDENLKLHSDIINNSNTPKAINKVNDILLETISSTLEIEEVDEKKPFVDLGIDSILSIQLINTLNHKLGINLRSTLFFDYTNISELSDYIENEYGDELMLQDTEQHTTKDTKHNIVQHIRQQEVEHQGGEQHVVEQLKKTLVTLISETLELDTEINENESFFDNGIDSIVGVEIIKKINRELGLNLRSTILFDYSDINSLVDYIIHSSEYQVQYVSEHPAEMERSLKVENHSLVIEDKDQEDSYLLDIFKQLYDGHLEIEEVDELMEGVYGTKN